MGLPLYTTLALTAPANGNVAALQSLASAGSLTINGGLAADGVAVLSSVNCPARRVSIFSTGNDAGVTWTIKGTNPGGLVIGEKLTGGNGAAVQSQLDYATITSISSSGATASTVRAQTTTTASTSWRMTDIRQNPFNIGVGIEISGTATVNVEFTFDDPNAATPGSIGPLSTIPPTVYVHPLVNQVTASTGTNFTTPCFAIRMTVTAGTGTCIFKAIQAGTGV